MSVAIRPPIYARILRLKHLQPNAVWCFVLFEGSIAVAALLALAEIVSWWTMIAAPLTVAVMVKLNDLIASGVGSAPVVGSQPRPSATGRVLPTAPTETSLSDLLGDQPAEPAPIFDAQDRRDLSELDDRDLSEINDDATAPPIETSEEATARAEAVEETPEPVGAASALPRQALGGDPDPFPEDFPEDADAAVQTDGIRARVLAMERPGNAESPAVRAVREAVARQIRSRLD